MVQKPADWRSSSGRRARHIWLNRMRCAPLSTVMVASAGRVGGKLAEHGVRPPAGRAGEPGRELAARGARLPLGPEGTRRQAREDRIQ